MVFSTPLPPTHIKDIHELIVTHTCMIFEDINISVTKIRIEFSLSHTRDTFVITVDHFLMMKFPRLSCPENRLKLPNLTAFSK